MTQTQTITCALERGLDFLAGRQLPSGQFPVEVTYHYQDGEPTHQDEALFATAHVVYSLGFLSHPSVQAMIARALTYFQAEMTGPGLWRYWNKTAERDSRRLCPFIPADLDDMANISHLLKHHRVRFPENRDLMLLNRDRAGRYYTWLMLRPTPTLNLRYWYTLLTEVTLPRYTIFWKVSEARYGDVDGVVNANVLLYLGARSETQPIIDWLIEIVRNGTEADCDKWYRDPFTFYYALSRNYHAGIEAFDAVRETILARLAEAAQPNGQVGESELHTALAANTWLNFGEAPALLENAIRFLVQAQNADGRWKTAPYYYGGPKKATSWGSEELTTGLCLEALHRFCTEAPMHASSRAKEI